MRDRIHSVAKYMAAIIGGLLVGLLIGNLLLWEMNR
jgi:hypothetical protein